MIDISLRASKIKMFFAITFAIFIFTLGYSIFDGIEYNTITLIVSGIALLIYISLHILKLNYFYLQNDIKNINIRFYNPHPFFRNYKQFQIPISYFVDYKIEKSFFGYRQQIVFKAKTKKGITDYPRISISALNKAEKSQLISILNKLKK